MPKECISAENTEEEKAECTDVTHEPATAPTDDGGVDLEELMSEDIDTLAQEFPELSSLNDLSELHSFERYTELRAAGATAVEAYLATAKRTVKQDSRAHLRSTVSAAASIPGGAMSARQLREAREIFTGMSDDEIRSLYKKVTK
jgi:hypothetical protein